MQFLLNCASHQLHRFAQDLIVDCFYGLLTHPLINKSKDAKSVCFVIRNCFNYLALLVTEVHDFFFEMIKNVHIRLLLVLAEVKDFFHRNCEEHF